MQECIIRFLFTVTAYFRQAKHWMEQLVLDSFLIAAVYFPPGSGVDPQAKEEVTIPLTYLTANEGCSSVEAYSICQQ